MNKEFKFSKYNSIENTYQSDFINKIKYEMLDDDDWIVTEKVHGANFSFWINGTDIRIAKRSCLIANDNGFYNSSEIMEKYKPILINIFNDIKTKYSNIINVVIYGELFGGSYPHKDVAKNNFAKAVQKGVFYSPNNDFYAFDIGIVYSDSDDIFFIPYTEAIDLFEKYDFIYAEPLYIGTLDDCLEYPNEFQTAIPSMFGLPIIENNICEGVVIKPNNSKFFNNGKRVILKNKNDKFKEETKRKVKAPIKLSDIGEKIKDEYISFININRLNNIISHIGNIKMEDFGLLMKNMMIDINEEFNKNIDLKKEFDTLEKKEQKIINKMVSREISELIKSNIKQITTD